MDKYTPIRRQVIADRLKNDDSYQTTRDISHELYALHPNLWKSADACRKGVEKQRGASSRTHLQTGSTRGFFSRGDVHPTDPKFVFLQYNYQREVWVSPKSLARTGEKIRALYYKYKEEDPIKVRDKCRRTRKNNIDHYRKYAREYVKKNPHIYKRRRGSSSNNIKLTPKDVTQMRRIYKDCELLNLAARSSGAREGFHVDHVHPLNGSDFCGLHAPWNLQILWASENMSKGNKLPA